MGGEFIWHIDMSGIKNTFHKMSTISFNNSSEAQQANFKKNPKTHFLSSPLGDNQV